jgi:lysophospholipase L1-like esterase
MLLAALAALAGAVAVVPATAAAQAPVAAPGLCSAPHVTNFAPADVTRPGVIDLYYFGAGGSRVDYFECIGDRAHHVGSAQAPASEPRTILYDAATWSCDRPNRRFVSISRRPDGTIGMGVYSVRTMSCAQRFELHVPRRVAPGSRLRVRVVDRWGIGGIRPTLCVTPPHERRACRTLAFPRAVAVASRRVRATTRGSWRIELRARGHRVRTSVAVGDGSKAAGAPAPLVLATGDSMMQGIDGFLTDELGDGARVRSDVRPGTGIGKGVYWTAWAAAQVARLRPSVTVMSIGANEGFAMPTPGGASAACCDEPWVAEYARRVRTMMRTYRRHGRGRVLWLTLPTPREARLIPIFGAVNRAILRAADGLSGVKVLRMDLLFTPAGYRDVMRYRGKSVRVREIDGVHLSISGTAIAATAIARELLALRGGS